MLVLSRKRSEMIQIGDDIVIKVIQAGRTHVKIGIEAPTNIRVMRAELCDAKGESVLAKLVRERRPAAMAARPKFRKDLGQCLATPSIVATAMPVVPVNGLTAVVAS